MSCKIEAECNGSTRVEFIELKLGCWFELNEYLAGRWTMPTVRCGGYGFT